MQISKYDLLICIVLPPGGSAAPSGRLFFRDRCTGVGKRAYASARAASQMMRTQAS